MFFKALLNGIGSGGGVAWSLYGIIFAALGGVVASQLSTILGIFFILLFLAIAASMFYFSYRKLKAEDLDFQKNLYENQKNLENDLDSYLFLIQKLTQFKHLKDSVLLNQDLHDLLEKDHHSLLVQVLSSPKYETVRAKLKKQPIKKSELFEPAYTGFIGSLGALIGCCAGLFGLLTGIGLFAGFTVLPVAAWAVVALSIVAACIFTCLFVYDERKKIRAKKENLALEKIHPQFQELIKKHQLELADVQAKIDPSGNDFESFKPIFTPPKNNSKRKDKIPTSSYIDLEVFSF